MNANVQIFSNPQFGNIRVLTNEKNDPFFVANDAARMLGYSNPRDAISKHCKSGGVAKCDIPINGVIQAVTIINEPNFYRLVMRSNMPDAEKVQDWVCEEILPSIRKTGGYLITKEDDTVDEIMARALIVANNTLAKREERIKTLESENTQQGETIHLLTNEIKLSVPKVQYVDTVLQSVNTYTSTQMAKELSMREAEQLHKALKENDVMFKQSGQWMLTAKYCSKGYTKPRTTTFVRSDGSTGTNTITVWTETGRAFLHTLFSKSN